MQLSYRSSNSLLRYSSAAKPLKTLTTTPTFNKSSLKKLVVTQNSPALEKPKEKEPEKPQAFSEPIFVIVRLRPYTGPSINLTSSNAKVLTLTTPYLIRSFDFGAICEETMKTVDIYKQWARQAVLRQLDGVNLSIICYGITGAGKTHTMFGDDKERGLVFECAEELLKLKSQAQKDSTILIDVSIYEIYNENVRDLSLQFPPTLNVAEDAKGEVFVKDLTKISLTSVDELRTLISLATSRRVKATTNKNMHSSRSHAIVDFTINVVKIVKGKPDNVVRTARLTMVDLAGSEKLSSHSHDHTKFDIRKAEGANINKSLLSLTNCILNLGDTKSFTNYRDSKLTRILKPSLGGNSKTIIIGCISRCSSDTDNTINTLNYCSKAASIMKKVQSNVQSKSSQEIERMLSKAKESSNSVAPCVVKSPISLCRDLHGPFDDVKAALKKSEPDSVGLIELMRGMVEKKKTIEEDFKKKKNVTEYFTAMATFNDLTLRILQLMESKDSTTTHSVQNQPQSSDGHRTIDQSLKIIDSRQKTTTKAHNISNDEQLQQEVRKHSSVGRSSNLREMQSSSSLYSSNSINKRWERRLKKFQYGSNSASPIKEKLLKTSVPAAPTSEKKKTSQSPDLFSSNRGSLSQMEEVMKLNMARQNYRNFKNELRAVYSQKQSIDISNSREPFDILCKIESLINSQKEHKYLLTKSQEDIMNNLKDFLKEQPLAERKTFFDLKS
jgi:hypothetical protein